MISKTGEKTVCERPKPKLISFEITTDNHGLSKNEPVNNNKRADETHILNSRETILTGVMVDYSSTGRSVESDANVTISTQTFLYLNAFL